MRDSPRGNFTTRPPPPRPSISRFGPATHRHEYSLFDDISRAPSYSYAQGDFPVRGGSLIRNNDRQNFTFDARKATGGSGVYFVYATMADTTRVAVREH